MKIVFHLEFLKPSRKASQSFKSSAAFDLFEEYVSRISRYLEIDVEGSILNSAKVLTSNDEFWICDRGAKAKILSSEAVADRLRLSLGSGKKVLRIVIGGPDGFEEEFFKKHPQCLRWSFGPMTLPHELASLVAAEQCYRAFTIIKNEPYHLGHK